MAGRGGYGTAGMRAAAWVAAFLVAWVGAPAFGQTPSSNYMLGPGDVLDIAIWGYPQFTSEVTVGPDGQITLPLAGTVAAGGVTVDRLTAVLTKAYAVYVVDPHVAVTIKTFRKIRAATIGQVAHPGSYDLSPGARLLDLIAASGGVTDAAGAHAQLLQPGQPALAVDLDKVLAGDPAANVPLRDGETLLVPEDLVDVVSVQGEVVHPGRFRLKGRTRVLDALLDAGGLKPTASLSRARLVHASGQSEPLRLDSMLVQDDMSQNVVLQPGDTIFIPLETNNQIYVVGDVNKPGAFVVQGPTTILEAIAMAGGPISRGGATAKSAYILRRPGNPQQTAITAGPAKTQTLPNGGLLITTDLAALMRNPNTNQDVEVQPGDVIVVPQRSAGLQVLVNILSGLGNFIKF